jgi:predicted tellurium resistance membrane protein TerC
MAELFFILQQIILALLLDIDNAVYMTSAIRSLSLAEQKKAIAWGLFAEFISRLILIFVLYSLLVKNPTFFSFLGIKFTPDSISLFIVGSFILLKNSKELYNFFTTSLENQQLKSSRISLTNVMVEMVFFNTLFSIDNIIALSLKKVDIPLLICLLLISAIIRLFAIDKMALFIHKYPSLNIVMTIFLILIGMELLLQGFWFSFPEEIFNGVMVLSIITALIYQRQQSRKTIK